MTAVQVDSGLYLPDGRLDLEAARAHGEFLLGLMKEASSPEEIAAVQAAIRKHAHVVAFDSPARLAEATDPEWQSAPHLELISDTIRRSLTERVTAIIEVPVRHGKSELISAHGPAWYLENVPNGKVISLSHSLSLAEEWGQRNRDLIEDNPDLFWAAQVRSDSRRIQQWKTTAGGVMISVGARGSITGKGANLMLVDDPVKDAEQAFSPAYREKFRRWWQMTIRTRMQRGGSIVIVQARWCEDDLAGWLQEHAAENRFATQWEVISLPALAEPGPEEAEADGFDPRKWRDPVGRKIGDPLWPEMWSADELEVAKADVGRLAWRALYQQKPVDAEGTLFPVESWTYVDSTKVPSLVSIIRKWDLAATMDESSDPDWTCGVLFGRDIQGFSYVLDVVRFRQGPAATDRMIAATAKRDGLQVPISFDQDPGSAGKRDAAYLAREVVPGHTVSFEPPRGKKMARGFAGQVQLGNVRLVRAGWNYEFVTEHSKFPGGRHDDMVDAAAAAFANTVDGLAVGGAVGSSVRS